jgi:ketosteroid isomerase-like protein
MPGTAPGRDAIHCRLSSRYRSVKEARAVNRRHLLAASVILPAALPMRAAQDPAVNEQTVRAFYDAILARDGDLTALETLMAEDFQPTNAGDVPGRTAYWQRRVDQRRTLDALYPRWRFVVDDLLAAGERVAVRAHLEAASFGRDTPDQTSTQLAWFELRDGQILRIWTEASDVHPMPPVNG